MVSYCGNSSLNIIYDGILPLCFLNTILFGINTLFLVALGGWKLSVVRGMMEHSIPYSRTQLLKVFLLSFLSFLPVLQTFLHLYHGNLFLYEVVDNSFISLSYLFCLYIVVVEYSRAMRNNWVVRIWFISTFVLTSLGLQSTLALERKGYETGSDLAITIVQTAAVTVLAVIGTFIDKKPEGYENLEDVDDDTDSSLVHSVSKRDIVTNANILSRASFAYLNPLLKLGYKRALEMDDLPHLPSPYIAQNVNNKFEEQWNKEKNKPKPSFWKVIFKAFGARFVLGGLFKLGNDVSQFVGPIMLGSIVEFIAQNRGLSGNDEKQTSQGLMYVGILSCSMILTSFFQNQYFYQCYNVGMQIRTATTNIVYKKAFDLSNKSRQSSTIGEMVNLQSIDAQKFQELIPFLHMIWSSPFQIFGSLFLLYRLLGWSALAGVVVMALLIPLNAKIATYIGGLHKKVMGLRDKRTKGMNEILSGIRIIKFFAWEESFIGRISKIREGEVEIMTKGLLIRSFAIFLWISSPILVSTSTFAVYTFLGNKLTPEKAFSSLALFNILRFPMNMLPNIITSLIEARVSTDRLVKFLSAEESDSDAVTQSLDNSTKSAIKLEDGTWNWDENVFPPVLDKISIDFPRGKLVAVVGPVGSGKSTLLSAILGDIPKLKGKAYVNGSKAYVAQQAWIQNASLRENIIFGSEFDQKKYDNVVKVCELRADIDMLPHGDSTEIGEKGINLSGGQRQRVSLARAVYQNKDIYLLDDCLSAVDAHVGKAIFNNCIVGQLANKSRILITHQLQFVNQADLIVVLREGKIAEMGTYQELMKNQSDFYSLINTHVKNSKEEEEDEEEGSSESQESSDNSSNGLRKSLKISTDRVKKDEVKKPEGPRAGNKIISEEQRGKGAIGLDLWKIYLYSIGSIIIPVGIVLIQLVGETGRVGGDFWLSHWADEMEFGTNKSSYYYLGIYSALALFCSVLVFFRGYAVGYSGITSATNLHNRILARVIRAPTAFFDTTPVGRILNIFSRDVNQLDDSLPRSIAMSMNMVFMTVATVFVISYIIPPFLTALLPLAYVYRYIQKYYLHSSREIKRLESITKSPIYAQFSETLAGVFTIKPYGRQDDFVRINNSKLDSNNSAYFAGQVANRWLSLRLDLIGALVVTTSTVFAVLERASLDPGSVGLMLSYGLSMTGTLSWLVRTVTDTETQMVSVERVDGYSKIDSEETNIDGGQRPSVGWPSQGGIVFKDAKLRYRPGLDLVLKGVDVTIKPMEKVGVVGRTGAGKSSLMLALFRFVELDSGSIIIDGMDISQLNLLALRRGLSIIPQDPTLFTGTVRSNLDPFEESSDTALWDALTSVHLKYFVEGLPEKLDAPVTEGGENFSVGQRQLLCLARAIIRKAKILIMDEATAAVDFETDSLIQKTIRDEFRKVTVLTIAHRIHTIMDYDKILVLDQGRAAEFDSPQTLLANPKTIFYSMTNQSGTVEKH